MGGYAYINHKMKNAEQQAQDPNEVESQYYWVQQQPPQDSVGERVALVILVAFVVFVVFGMGVLLGLLFG